MRSTRYRVDHGRARTNSDTRTASPHTVHTIHRCARERNLMRCRLGRASGKCSLRLVQLAAEPRSIAHPRVFAVAAAQAGACRGFERRPHRFCRNCVPVPAVDPSRGPGSRNRRTSTDPAIKRSRSEYDRRSSMRTLKNLVVSIGALAILAALGAVALAQNNVDTIVTNGKILTVDAGFRIVQALAIRNGRIVATRHERGSRALRGSRTRGSSTSPARPSSLASSTTTSTSRAAPTPGTSSPASRALTRAAKRCGFSRPRRRACHPASGSWCRAAGRRGSSPTRQADSRSRSSTAWRRRIRCSSRRAIASSTRTASRSKRSV